MKLRALLLLAAFLRNDTPDLHDPARPAAPLLSRLPGVESVEVVNARSRATHRIVHLLNWHFIPKPLFAADLRSQSQRTLSDDEIDRRYARFLDDVEAIQQEQMEVFRRLIHEHGLRQVYYEGFSKAELPAFRQLVTALKRIERRQPRGETAIEQFLRDEYRNDLLRLGAPGRLLMSGELDAVLPVEDAALLKAANPVQNDGTVRLDEDVIRLRENAIVGHLLEGGPVSVVVLGGAHDLSNNLPESCEYIRVQTKQYAQTAE